MANAELSQLIEDELKKQGFYEGSSKVRKQEQDDEEKALIGALRVEARVKEHQHQKHVLTLKRSICIGGGLLLIIILWVVLATKSKQTGSPQQVLPRSTPSPLPYSSPPAPKDTPNNTTPDPATPEKVSGASPQTADAPAPEVQNEEEGQGELDYEDYDPDYEDQNLEEFDSGEMDAQGEKSSKEYDGNYDDDDDTDFEGEGQLDGAGNEAEGGDDGNR